jgi:N6-adenosine-specific RNA methylase IME4
MLTRPIASINIGARHRKEFGDLTALAHSIDEQGLLQPLAITPDNTLIAGERRLRAWSQTKFADQEIPVHVVNLYEIVRGEWAENTDRKDFTPSEIVAIKRALEPKLKEAAKDRQGTRTDIVGNSHNVESGRVHEKLSAFVGKDRKTIEKAEAVVDAAEAEPEKYAELVEVMDRTGKVNGPWRRLQVLRQVEEIKRKKETGQLDLPVGKFDRIVVDVPWPHEPDDPAPALRGRATRDYPTMSIEEIKSLPVAERAATHCVLYMWVTGFHMRYAYEVLDAWGFRHAPLIIVWAKDRWGKGQRLRQQCEFVVVAINGKPPWNTAAAAARSTRLDGPVREDSRKPDEFYQLIDEITPAQRSLELFPRRELPAGWIGYGDQVGQFKTTDTSGSILATAPQPGKPEHNVTTSDTQRLLHAKCDCGWSYKIRRKSRGRKYREAAIRRHLESAQPSVAHRNG